MNNFSKVITCVLQSKAVNEASCETSNSGFEQLSLRWSEVFVQLEIWKIRKLDHPDQSHLKKLSHGFLFPYTDKYIKLLY